jgi:hypothetical protein
VPDDVRASDRDKDRDKDKPDKADKPERDKKDRKSSNVAIELEVSRQRSIGWTLFGLIVGTLLIWKLGTVGRWVGVVLVVIGTYRAWQLVQTFLYPPGTIVVNETEVTLPRGLCLPRPLKIAPNEVTAVYFLRRSVPWNKSAPVLVVEVGDKAIPFPRDWFASEADQRHVVHALLRTAKLDSSDAPEPKAEKAEKSEKADKATDTKSEPAPDAAADKAT